MAAVTRRSLLRGALGGAAATALTLSVVEASAAGSMEAPVADDNLAVTTSTDYRYIDLHTHLGQTWDSSEVLTAEALVRWMDTHAIAQAIVLPLTSPESSTFLLTNDFVLGETKRFPDRLIPFCAVDPRTTHEHALVDLIKRWVDAGAKGFGEHKAGLPIDHPLNMAVYAACAELNVPVLFHLDNERNMDTPGLPGLENALRQHPDCTFIGHGPGWWASIAGDTKQADMDGYPTGSVTAGGAVDRLMRKYGNLYADLSAGSGASAISRDLAFGRQFLTRWQDRIFFGTDYLSPGQDVPQFELFEKQLILPKDVQAKIFMANARKLLGLR
jgi:predicted TIM-barrel fold metal-dependent hydrolase